MDAVRIEEGPPPRNARKPDALLGQGKLAAVGIQGFRIRIVSRRALQVKTPVGENPVLNAIARRGILQDVAVQLIDEIRVDFASLEYAPLELYVGVAQIQVNFAAAVGSGTCLGDNLAFIGGNAGANEEVRKALRISFSDAPW